MKISTIAGAVAVVLISSFAAAQSSAQEINDSGIEVITITAKRLAPTIATSCVNAAIASRSTAAGTQNDSGNADALGNRGAIMKKMRQDIRHCIEQAQGEARI